MFVRSMDAADELLLMIVVMIIVVQEAFMKRVNVLVSVLVGNAIQVLDGRLRRRTRVLDGCDLLPARQARLLRPNPHAADATDEQASISNHGDVYRPFVGLMADLAGQARRQVMVVVEEHQYRCGDGGNHEDRPK